MAELIEGKPFPNLSMTDRTGNTVKLSDLKGSWLCLFVTADPTPAPLESLKTLAQLLTGEETLLAGFVDDAFPAISGCVQLTQKQTDLGILPSDRFSLFLVDPNGMLRRRYPESFEPSEVLTSLRSFKMKWLSTW